MFKAYAQQWSRLLRLLSTIFCRIIIYTVYIYNSIVFLPLIVFPFFSKSNKGLKHKQKGERWRSRSVYSTINQCVPSGYANTHSTALIIQMTKSRIFQERINSTRKMLSQTLYRSLSRRRWMLDLLLTSYPCHNTTLLDNIITHHFISMIIVKGLRMCFLLLS